MHRSRHKEIRQALKENPDGLTVLELVAITGIDQGSARQALKLMPDVYLDRWIPGKTNWAAVWCIVDVPEDCPKPTKEK